MASVEKKQEGVLLQRSDGRHQWTGRWKIGLEGGLDERRDVGTLGDVFAEEDGFQVATRDEEGYLMVIVSGPDGSAFVGSTEPGEDAVSVATASRCFTLRDGESSFDTY